MGASLAHLLTGKWIGGYEWQDSWVPVTVEIELDEIRGFLGTMALRPERAARQKLKHVTLDFMQQVRFELPAGSDLLIFEGRVEEFGITGRWYARDGRGWGVFRFVSDEAEGHSG